MWTTIDYVTVTIANCFLFGCESTATWHAAQASGEIIPALVIGTKHTIQPQIELARSQRSEMDAIKTKKSVTTNWSEIHPPRIPMS